MLHQISPYGDFCLTKEHLRGMVGEIKQLKTTLMSQETFVVPPGFFNFHTHFDLIKDHQKVIAEEEIEINNVCKSMVPLIKSKCFKKGVSVEVDRLFFLKEITGNSIVENEEELNFTGNDFFEAIVKKSALRSLTNQGPVKTTYHLCLPKEHTYFSKTDTELRELIAEISKETEPFGFCFLFANRQHAHDLCISAVYYFDKAVS